jgi:hypothetical protein
MLTGVDAHAHAQSVSNATIASPVRIVGDVRDGDIVRYDSAGNTYRAAEEAHDTSLFGVVVDDPVLYVEGLEGVDVRPVVRFGEARVNVSTLGGEVRAGDLVTSSRIRGVGARADAEEDGFVLGFALEHMTYDASSSPLVVDGTEVQFGFVTVALRIGPHSSNTDALTSTSTGVGALTELLEKVSKTEEGVDPFKVFRYILGSGVAIAAVVLALRRFGDLFAQSVISVGRNPLARTQIRSILVWNAVLIIVVSSVGLGLGVAIIILP